MLPLRSEGSTVAESSSDLGGQIQEAQRLANLVL